uniref:inorganic diphosphatase n=1 Tax=Picea sitchensis TaxID=3332 RepID=B8LPR8_PICSI|nr:unknown [Picea sitchensis]
MAALRTVAAVNVVQSRLASNNVNSIVISRPAVLYLQCGFPSVKALKQQRWLRAKPRGFTCRALYRPDIETKEEGTPQTLDYRIFFFEKSGKKISPWHDIPLQLGDGVFNFVAEIPKESSAKMEIATEEPYTPIKQDTKKGKLRYYPYNINWNYGLLHKHGKIHLLQMQKLKEHLVTTIQLMWLRLGKGRLRWEKYLK